MNFGSKSATVLVLRGVASDGKRNSERAKEQAQGQSGNGPFRRLVIVGQRLFANRQALRRLGAHLPDRLLRSDWPAASRFYKS